MAISSKEINNTLFFFFKKVGRKSKDIHKYKNCLQNNYLKSLLGLGGE